ncbi:hypothetical protein ACNOYE_33145 [Nannocystaceae bacterium ST9]
MSSRKILCVVSLTSFIGIAVALLACSDVHADGEAASVIDEATRETAASFVGEYRFVGGQKERDGIDAAIETSLDAVNPVVRAMGRSRLQESNEVPATIEITLQDDTLAIHQAGEAHAARIDGSKLKTKSKQGDKINVSHRISSGKLTQKIVGDGGDRTNRYKLSNEGKRLTLSVEITSGHLPVPVSYSLTYERR